MCIYENVLNLSIDNAGRLKYEIDNAIKYIQSHKNECWEK